MRKVVVAGIVAAIAIALSGILALELARDPITERNFNKLPIGTSYSVARALLGPPKQEDCIAAGGWARPTSAYWERYGATIFITLNSSECVSDRHFNTKSAIEWLKETLVGRP